MVHKTLIGRSVRAGARFFRGRKTTPKPKPKPNIGVLAGISGGGSRGGMPSPTPSGGGGRGGGGGGGGGGRGGGTPSPFIDAGRGTTQAPPKIGVGVSGGGASLIQRQLLESARRNKAKRDQRIRAREQDIRNKKQAIINREILRKKTTLTFGERISLRAQFDVRDLARERGRGFTKKEIVRLIEKRGGSLKDLRNAQRKGFRIVRQKIGGKVETKEITGIVTPIESPKGFLEKELSRNNAEILRIQTKQLRGEKLTVAEQINLPLFIFNKKAGELNIGAIKLIKLSPKAIPLIAKTPKFAVLLPSEILKIPSRTKKLIADRKNIIPFTKKQAREIKSSGKRFGNLVRVSPSSAVASIGSEIVLFKIFGEGLKLVGKVSKRGIQALDPKGKRILTDAFGVKKVKVAGVGDLELIPRGKNPPLIVRPTEVVKITQIPFKKIPRFPRTTGVQKEIINVVKKRGDVITGSFAQETLVKKQFTRKFKDLDILTKNRPALIKELRKKLGKRVRFKKKFRSIQVFVGKRQIADLVNIAKGEEGFVKKFGIVKVKGLRLASQESRLASKVQQLGFGKRGKVVKDIESLTGRKVDLNKPSIRGAFGFSKKELKAVIGKTGPITTSQIDLLGRGIIKPKDLKLQKILFATPFNPKSKIAQTRITRLGINEKEANLLDYLSGDFTFKGSKPQIFIFPKEKIFPKKIRGKGFRVPLKSSELEVVLDKGFIIKRQKRLATVMIKGKRVPIYKIRKVKPSKELKIVIDKFKKGKLSKSQIKKLDKTLKKKTGFDYKLSRSSSDLKKLKKVVSLKSKIGSGLLKRFSKVSRSKIKSRGKISRPPSARPSPRIISRPPSGRPSGRPSIKPLSRPVSRPPSRPPSGRPVGRPPPPRKKILVRPSKIRRLKKPTPKPKEAFNVFARPLKKRKGQKQPKLIKVNKVPLTKQRARDLRNYITDTSLSRTASIRLTKGKPKQPRLKVPKSYAKRTTRKFRRFRIVKGRKKALPRERVIERRKNILDTRGEKRQITLRRRIKQITPKKKRLTKRTKKSIHLERLRNLRKARRVLSGKRR